MYLRKSRADVEAEARGEGETLARHERTLLDLAARMKISMPPENIFREIISGDTIIERPIVQQMLHEVEAGLWQGVFVMDIDRLARGETIDQGIVAQAFKYTSTRIITPYKTYDPENDMDEEFMEFGLFMARREYKTIKRRMQAGRTASVREGRYLGTRAPYGYARINPKGGPGPTLEIVPEKADIVRSVFSWYAHGIDGQSVGAQIIANKLNSVGIKTELGNKFDASRIRSMLQNPTYIGMVQWNQRKTAISVRDGIRTKSRRKSAEYMLINGLHAPIIDKDLWDRVHDMFASHEKRPINGARAIKNPLAGLVKCGACGRAMIRKPDYSGRDDLLHCSNPHCDMPGTYVPVVEQSIVDILRYWICEYAPTPIQGQPEEASDDNALLSARQQITTELGQLNSQKAKLHELLEREVYSIETFMQRNEDVTTRINAAETALGKLVIPVRKDVMIRSVVPIARTIVDAYELTKDPAQRNALLKSVIEQVIYRKSKACHRGENPTDYMELDVMPRIPKQ